MKFGIIFAFRILAGVCSLISLGLSGRNGMM